MSTDARSDWLIADQLKAELPCSIIGREIIVLEQTSSTNDAILRLASTEGLPSIPEGLVVFAEHQTAGRGQRGNRWESTGRKGLWFSILLRPEIRLSDSRRLTIWAIETISDAMHAEVGLEPVVKLPNDVQVNGRKAAGVLVEMRAQNNAPHLAVMGIGINVNQSRDDFPVELQDRAISLAIASGHEIDRQKFAVALLQKLDTTYRQKFLDRDSVEGGSEPGPGIAPAPTTSPVPTTRRDKRAGKFRTA